ncbi:MAG: DNA adenine methylase [Planctomycetota bacterium]
MKIKAVAPWFGGKRTLAPRIVAELGEHRAYLEPFVGGISVPLVKPRARKETLNDLHGDLTHLAMVVASSRAYDLYDRVTRTLYSESVFEYASEVVQSDDPAMITDTPHAVTLDHVERAWAYLVVSWMGRNGAAGTERVKYQFTTRYTGNGGDSATRWASVAASVPAWHDRLIGVDITRRDGLALIEKFEDAPGVAIYCDPPYLAEGGAYAHRFAAGGVFGDDHARLADALNAKQHTRVVVSYYADARLDELYPGNKWTRVQIDVNKKLAAQNHRGTNHTRATEVLLINGPSHTAEAVA